MARNLRSSKKNEIEASSSQPRMVFDYEKYIHEDCLDDFRRLCLNRNVCNQNVVDLKVLETVLGSGSITNLLKTQKLTKFVSLNHEYNKDLVKVFNSGLHGKTSHSFKFKIGGKVYKFSMKFWEPLFGLKHGNNRVKYNENNTQLPNYNRDTYFSGLCKNGRMPQGYMKVGALKMENRVLHWIISHVLRPKYGSFARVDNPEADLMYFLKNKIKIDWPHFIIDRLFEIKDGGKLSVFSYCSMIGAILDHFKIGANDEIPLEAPGKRQVLSTQTMGSLK
ncbi:hypothetical protein A2U01_0007550 [Trifolium medium]|uniref:Uncharacterized protein n=1 Tax=Trifolium medium TaxID=97028 RepID=A0A392MGR0_9FABA|nr:hypothetical protein [Trifolium medium]